MKWTLKLVAEMVSGRPIECEIATIKRPELSSQASIGLTIGEGKSFWQAYSGESSRPRFNSTVPAFNRVPVRMIRYLELNADSNSGKTRAKRQSFDERWSLEQKIEVCLDQGMVRCVPRQR